jgi:hypothetical protein
MITLPRGLGRAAAAPRPDFQGCLGHGLALGATGLRCDADSRVATPGKRHEALGDTLEVIRRLGEVEPLREHLVRQEAGELGQEGGVVRALRADEDPAPGLLAG